MVVPYHPAVLLAWGAHMNIQCVTESSWSFYVLKYAAKMMLPTNFKLDATSLSSLGLDGISEQHAQLAAASVLLKTVCPCEAHHILAGRPIIYHSDKITYVPTHPPEWRRLQILYRNGAQQVVSGTTALQTYLQRPQCPVFDNYTLVEYFQYFEVRRSAALLHDAQRACRPTAAAAAACLRCARALLVACNMQNLAGRSLANGMIPNASVGAAQEGQVPA
jgi:hypothetical protein